MAGDSKQLAFDSLMNGRLGFDTDQENAIRNAITLFYEQGIPLEATLGLLPTDANSPINRAIQTSVSVLSALGHGPNYGSSPKRKRTIEHYRLIADAYCLLSEGLSDSARQCQIAEDMLRVYQNKNALPSPNSEYERLIQKLVLTYGTCSGKTAQRAVRFVQNCPTTLTERVAIVQTP